MSHRYSAGGGHTRNKTSLGSITYADLANTFSRSTGNAPGLPSIAHNAPPTIMMQQQAHHGHHGQHHPQHHPQQQARYRSAAHHPQGAGGVNEQVRFERLSKVPRDREIPDGVDAMVVGDVVERYNALRGVERKLDATMTNKRLAAKDGGLRHEKRLRVMRVWVTCEASKSGESRETDESFNFDDKGGPIDYKMRVEGRLLPDLEDDADSDDEDDEKEAMDVDKPETAQKQLTGSTEPHKFLQYFKRISVVYQPTSSGSAPPPQPLIWNQPDRLPQGPAQGSVSNPQETNYDALEFTPRFDGPYQKLAITLHRAEGTNRLRGKLSEPLARLLDREYDDQGGAMLGLYNYVRLKGLEEDGQPQKFRCDDLLRAVCSHQVLIDKTNKSDFPTRCC
jgi:SWI/SNF-related matrix-associated actin-dependent regulator of chromatin subfamily D